MSDVNVELVRRLEGMLDAAREGEITGLSYFHDGGGRQTWGHIGLSDHGQLLAAACLGGLAVNKEGAT